MYGIVMALMIGLCCTACFPQVYFTAERVRSEGVAIDPSSPAYNLEGVAAVSTEGAGGGEDASEEDFNLEVLSDERPKKGVEFDIPIVINAKVEQFVQYFQTTLRNRFSNWLALSGKYIPIMRALLRENGLPEDLVYLALIESGFNPYAYSRSKACGPWQFIYLTGKRYGLRVDWWVDERRDPEKSTVAAAKYLKDLYDMFACWYLAAASYNAGENKIAAAMKRYRTEDFWELTKYRYLKQETKDYVPQMIAAALIAKDPEKYGFVGIEYQEPLRYEKVNVPPLTSLSLIAAACEITLDELKELNPQLLRWCTPPEKPYEIKIPLGKKERFLKNFETLQPSERPPYRIHVVKRGENLVRVSRLYGVNGQTILDANQLGKGSRLSPGMNLIIPLPPHAPSDPNGGAKLTAKKKGEGRVQPAIEEGEEEILYTIKKGDTLWAIANEMGVNIGALSRWNNLHPEKKLRPGDKLRVRVTTAKVPPEPAKKKGALEIIYEVKEGDTLWGIAKKYNLTIDDIRSWNNLEEADRIYPSDRLRLRLSGLRSSTLN
jgi:membrane-bound lytic murein transglycosylase D